jgi:hypothetical protein
MKTLGRIFIILAVTALVTGAIYLIVNASGTGTASDFPQRGEQFQPGGARPEFEGGREPRELGEGWAFGLTKNLGVISLLVAIIVLPKSLGKRKRLAAVKADSREAG